MKNRKNKLTTYLCGAMEAAKNLGAGWRAEITPFLEELGLEVLNPVEFEPHQLKGLQPNRLPEFYTDFHGNQVKPEYWHELKNAQEKHLYKRFLKYMRRIIQYDMRLVRNEVDFIIVLWDKNAAKGAGTHAEMTEGFLQNLPIYCVAKSDIPAWAKATCTEIFLSFDELRDFLKEEFDYE